MIKDENLVRGISKFGLAAIALNGFIGAAIFALPSSIAQSVGGFASWTFLACALLMLPVVLSFAKAASYFNNTGGPILYTGTAFGSFVGFQTGWLLYLGRVTALAANSNALVDYGALLFSDISSGVARVAALTFCFLSLVLVNVFGVRQGMRITNILTILKLAPLLLFIFAGLSYIVPEKSFATSPPSIATFAETLLLVVYAFVGFEGAVVPAGESKVPKRDLPRALLLTLGLTTLLYVLIQSICTAILPELMSTKTPLADAAEVLFGNYGLGLMLLAAFLSIAGNISAIVLSAPRMTYTLATENTLPAWLGVVHSKYRTPSNSIVFLGAIGFILAVSGTFKWLAIMSSLTRMIGYSACILSLPRLRKVADSDFNLPMGNLIPISGLIICVSLSLQANADAWFLTAGFAVFGSILYVITKKRPGKTQ